MSQLLKHRLITPLVVFLITTIFWLLAKTAWYEFISLFFGLLVGSFILDLDHFIYWFYLQPQDNESRLVQLAFTKKDWPTILQIYLIKHQTHQNLIFHHHLFQIILVLISLFVFTSSGHVFGMAALLALHLHLFSDQFQLYRQSPDAFQDQLFARSSYQLPLSYLNKYLVFYAILMTVFFLLLLQTRL